VSRRRKLPSPEEIVAAIVELARRFPRLGSRDLGRALRRAIAQGFVIERRGPDGSFHLAVSSEGWNLHRSG